jgi:hypothetical protein
LEEVCRTYRGRYLAELPPPPPPPAADANTEVLLFEKSKLPFLLTSLLSGTRIVLLLGLEASKRTLAAMVGTVSRSHTLTVLSLLPVARSQASEGFQSSANPDSV